VFKNYLLRLACAFWTFRFGMKWKIKWYGNSRDVDVFSWIQVYAVALHETGNLDSSLYKRANNAFGMRVPSRRKWFGNGEDNNYSTYSSVWMSVRDYFEWLDYNKFSQWFNVDFIGAYVPLVVFMKENRYFEASLDGYNEGVEYFMGKSEKLSNPLTSLLVMIFGPTFIFAIWKFYKKIRTNKSSRL
jgi:hypothetical protein